MLENNTNRLQYDNYSIETLNKMIDMSEDKENEESARLMFRIGEEIGAQGRFKDSLEYHEKALDIRLKKKMKDEDIVQSYIALGNIQMILNDSEKAKNYLMKAEELTKNKIGDKNELMAEIWFHLGELYNSQNNLNDSESFHKKSLDLKLSLNDIGKDHCSSAASYLQHGILLRNIGKPKEGLKEMIEAKKIYDEIYYDNYPQLCEVSTEIAKTYMLLSEFYTAIEFFNIAKRKLKIWEPESTDLANIYSHIGSAYSCLHDYEKAEFYHKKSLSNYSKIKGDDDIAVASCYNNLGLIFKNKSEFEKATAELQKALKIFESKPNKDMNLISSCKMNLGLTYAGSGDSRKAETYLEESKKIRENLVNNDLELADLYFNIGCMKQNVPSNCEEANNLFTKALKIRERIFGPNHYDIASIYFNFGMMCLEKNQIETCVDYFEKVIKIYEVLYTKNNIFTSEISQKIGTTFDEKKSFENAINFYIIAIESRKGLDFRRYDNRFAEQTEEEIKKREKDNNEKLAECYLSLGKAYLANGKDYKEGKIVLENAVKIFEEIDGEASVRVKDCFTNLSQLCSKLGEQNLAKEYSNKAK